MYADLDVDVLLAGVEKPHFNFVPGAPTSIGLRLCKAQQRCRPAPSPPRREFPATTARAIVLLSFRVPVRQLRFVTISRW